MCRWLPSQFSLALLNARLRSRRPCISRYTIFFPHWEYFVPTLGIICSHLGNISYVIDHFLLYLTGGQSPCEVDSYGLV